MDTIGVDLHKRESQLCILQDDGQVVERRIATTRERFTAVLGGRPPARILLEASTESEWVARHLESLGHEVIVSDPNYAPMYATRTRRVKTDKRDARTLADACRQGTYRVAHRVSAERRHVRAELAVREALVRTRTRYVSLAKALVRRDGLRVASSEAHLVALRIAALELSDQLAAELAPLFRILQPINEQIAAADQRIAALTKEDAIVARLTTAPSVGPITASAVVATVDNIARVPVGAPVRGVSGVGAGRAKLRGETAHRPDYQGGEFAGAVSARRGRLAHLAIESGGHCGAARVGARNRGAAREAHRGRRARPPLGRDPLRDVA